jgi:hypothetical protein
VLTLTFTVTGFDPWRATDCGEAEQVDPGGPPVQAKLTLWL